MIFHLALNEPRAGPLVHWYGGALGAGKQTGGPLLASRHLGSARPLPVLGNVIQE